MIRVSRLLCESWSGVCFHFARADGRRRLWSWARKRWRLVSECHGGSDHCHMLARPRASSDLDNLDTTSHSTAVSGHKRTPLWALTDSVGHSSDLGQWTRDESDAHTTRHCYPRARGDDFLPRRIAHPGRCRRGLSTGRCTRKTDQKGDLYRASPDPFSTAIAGVAQTASRDSIP